MTEGLISRVHRLVAGGVNELVDTIENAAPETVMREAIREIDRATDEVRDALGLAIANRHHANKRLMEATAKHDELADKARFALDQGRDDLAEAAIARQLDVEAQIPVLEASMKELAEEQAELESYISALLARKREMESDLATYLETRTATNTAAHDTAAGPAAGHALKADKRADKAESAFNRVLHGATGAAASTAADAATAAKLAELEEVTRDHRIQERLSALKAVKEDG